MFKIERENAMSSKKMTMVEAQVSVAAPPEILFAIYADVVNWAQWDPDTRSSILEQGLKLGSKGSLTPAKGRTIPIEVTAVEENRRFTVTSRTWLFRLDFEHELEPIMGGTQVIHRVRIAGLLRPLLTRMLAPRIEDGLPVTLLRLKAQAEAVRVD